MILQIIILLASLAFIVFGADWLVDGASAIARKAGISEFVIGLTIVGFGTSCPELVVSLTGAFAGNADISIGNVVGSNIFNTLLILGVTALAMPVAVSANNRRRDIPITLGVAVLLVVFGLTGNTLTRIEGVVFLLIFSAYMYYCFKFDDGNGEAEEDTRRVDNVRLAVGLVALGLAGLIAGGHFFVESATKIAGMLGVSDKFIAITVLAGGTSLPELATCIVAAVKRKGSLALGNILGSNVFNILLILGLSAVVTPLSFAGMDAADMGMLVFSAAVLLVCAFTGKKDTIDRWEGAVMLAAFALYYVWLFVKA